MPKPALSVLALVLASTVCGSAGAADDAAALSVYRDAELGFTYNYPAGFQSNAELAASVTKGLNQAATADSKESIAKCITVPLTAIRQDEAKNELALLFLMRFNHACLGTPGDADKLGAAATLLPQNVLAQFGTPTLEAPVRYKLDAHDAAYVRGSVPAKTLGEGATLSSGTVCSLIKANTVCWLILDSDAKQMSRPDG